MLNVASRLVEMANRIPDNIAIAQPRGYNDSGKRIYQTVTFRLLDQNSDRVAQVLLEQGVKPGIKLALMVRQGVDFITLVFGILKSGATIVLVDPGMGVRRMLRCLAEIRPDGFLAIPQVQAVRVLMKWRFPKAKHNLTVGKRLFWGGPVLKNVYETAWPGTVLAPTGPDDPAAIIFTSGSTGPPKGVLFTHGIFDTQIEQIRDHYGIQPGDIDLAAFPFFGLFNAVMGTTAVIPDMDSTRPASVNPENILEAVDDWHINQSFGSPALWKRVAEYCLEHEKKLTTLKRVISAGSPIPAPLLAKLKTCIHPDGDIHTPYGATESLPVASISATEVLGETVERSNHGAGTCVGKRFSLIQWCVIPVTDEPVRHLEDVPQLEIGRIGELVVTGPQVTKQYVTRLEANAYAKMTDSHGNIWHRIGDVGYLDEKDRFWFCGRKSHRVETEHGPMYTIPCEAIFNQHPWVSRAALVGLGPMGHQIPVVYIEPKPGCLLEESLFRDELREIGKENILTTNIEHFLFLNDFPVDIRHNTKINRELLAVMAARSKPLRRAIGS